MKKIHIDKKKIRNILLIFLAGILTGVILFSFLKSSEHKDELSDRQHTDEKTIENETKDEPSSSYANWSKDTVYLGGDQVVYQNKIYKAKWWTQGETPGTSDVWEDTLATVNDTQHENKESTKEIKPHVDTGDKKLVGYFPSWKPGKSDMIRYDLMSDVIYAFAIPTKDGDLRALDEPETAKTIIKKAHEQNVRVLIAIGGWSYQDVPLEATFMAATENKEKIHKFADAIIKLCDEYGFDGVDMDWEHPRVDGTSAKQYEELMLYLAEKLHAKDKLLTSAVLSGVTADGNVYYDAAAHSDKVLDVVDRIHVMAYDGGDGERHSTYEFAMNCGTYWIKTRGVDPNKVILGVPFYARPSWASYGDILSSVKSASDKDHVNYQGMDIYYNGISTMKKKAQYAKENLGGIMVWELTQDSNDEKTSLMSAISEVLEK